MLTTRTTVTAFLGLPDIRVPYGPRSALLGLEAFPLALDGIAHHDASVMIDGVLRATAAAHARGLEAASEVTARTMSLAAGGRLDVAGGLVEPALSAWIAEWFGLEGRGDSLMRCGRLILHATFLNPAQPKGEVDIEGLRRAIDWVASERTALIPAMDGASAGSVADALLAVTRDADAAARHVLALTVGPLALGAWSLDLAVDDLLDRSWVLDGITTDEQGRDAFDSALRRRPPLPGVVRTNPSTRNVPTAGSQVTVPAGPVLAATACADRLDASVERPSLAFGFGAHECLGRGQMRDIAAVVLRGLGAGSPRRIEGRRGRMAAGPGPSGVRSWPFPGRLEVQLLR